MPNFTLPNGTAILIDATKIVRCRSCFEGEIDEHPEHIGTALFKPKRMVMEPCEEVGPALQATVSSFTSLTGLSDRRLWFDANKAADAQTPRPSESGSGVLAIIPVGGIRMRVMESVADAQAVIGAART